VVHRVEVATATSNILDGPPCLGHTAMRERTLLTRALERSLLKPIAVRSEGGRVPA